MADIRCPMCGRPNPPDQDVCRFCQARLKPLVITPSSGEGAPLTPGEPPVQASTPDLESSLPDWLRDLRQKDEQTPAHEPPPGREEALPDWLTEGAEETPPTGEAGLEDSSNWWSRISQDEAAPPETSPPADAQDQAAAFPTPGREAKEEESLPDWLTTLGSDDYQAFSAQEGAGETPAAPPASKMEEGEEPDWLQRIRSRQQEEEQPPREIFLPDQEEDAGAQEFPFGSPALPPREPPPASQESDLPDWLSRLSSSGPAADQSAQAASAPRDEKADLFSEQLSGWSDQDEGGLAEAKPASQEGIPSWLSGLGRDEPAGRAGEETAQPAEEPPPALPEEGIPDWLKKLESNAYDRPAESSVPAFVVNDETELPLDVGAELEDGEMLAQKDEAPAEPPYLATLPEWLSQVSAETESPEGEPSQDEQEESLAPAQLPTWLEAMRPVEAAAPSAPVSEEQSTQIEKVGPLAGLRGVIPAEPVIGHLRKPPAYSVKMQVSESQHRSSVLLQKLLASEGEARPTPARPAFTSQAVLRLLIAAALFLAVLLPLWLNSQRLPLPDPTYIPDGLIETLDLIGTLNSGEPVLLAIDYEPGLSAEMDAASYSVVEQIAARGTALALVSTNPAGPLLAERLMGSLNRDRGQEPFHYANLGLIAGGPTGLLSFAASPRKILPFDLGSSGQLARSNLWDLEPFSSVQSVADFAMVVVITENADTARSWVEQVQPSLQPANVPLVMVVSAQVEPMVRPYFESYPQQINGLVSGLQGGAAYEGMTGQAGPVRGYWDAFGWGLLVAEALILVGGLINILLALLMPRKGAEVEGSQ